MKEVKGVSKMVRFVSLSLSVVVLTFFLLVTTFAQTVGVIDDTFTDFTGQTVPFDSWSVSKLGTGAGSSSVTDDGGSNVLKINATTASQNNTYGARRTLASATDGNNVSVAFRYKSDYDGNTSTTAGIKYVTIYDNSATPKKIIEMRIQAAVNTSDATKTNIAAMNGATATFVGTYQAGIWFNVQVDLNFKANPRQATITIDNQTPVTIGLTDTTAANYVSKLDYTIQKAGDNCYIDDIVINKILPDNADKTNLETALNTANALVSAAGAAGNDLGQYPQNALEAISTAISTAQTIHDTSNVQSDIDNAADNLNIAVATFRASFNPESILSQDYENGDITSLGWINQSTGTGTVTIGTKYGDDGSGNKSLQFAKGTGILPAQAINFFDPLTGKACVNFDTVTNNANVVKVFIFYNSFGMEIARVAFADTGKIRVTGSGAYTDYSAYTANTWYNIQVSFDLNNDLFAVAVNGKEICSKNLRTSSDDLAKMVCTTSGAGTSFEIDNLQIKGLKVAEFASGLVAAPGVTANVRLNNKAGTNVYMGLFNADGELKGITLQQSTGTANELVTITYPIVSVDTGDYVKMFIWNADMSPAVAESYRLNQE